MTQKIAIRTPLHNFVRCPAISLQLHVSTNGKMLKQYLFQMANFGSLTAEIGLPVCGTPTNFDGFRVLASLLQRRPSPEANQTLHDVWPSPGLQRYIYTVSEALFLTEFCTVQNSLYVQVFRSCMPTLATLLHGTPAAGVSQPNFVSWYKEWN